MANWCPKSAQRAVVTEKGFTCACGKHYSKSLLKPLQEGADLVSVIPRHHPKNEEVAKPMKVADSLPYPRIKIRVEEDATLREFESQDLGEDIKAAGTATVVRPMSDTSDKTAPVVESIGQTDGGEGPGSNFVYVPAPTPTNIPEPRLGRRHGVAVYRVKSVEGEWVSVVAASLADAVFAAQYLGPIATIELLPGMVIV